MEKDVRKVSGAEVSVFRYVRRNIRVTVRLFISKTKPAYPCIIPATPESFIK